MDIFSFFPFITKTTADTMHDASPDSENVAKKDVIASLTKGESKKAGGEGKGHLFDVRFLYVGLLIPALKLFIFLKMLFSHVGRHFIKLKICICMCSGMFEALLLPRYSMDRYRMYTNKEQHTCRYSVTDLIVN